MLELVQFDSTNGKSVTTSKIVADRNIAFEQKIEQIIGLQSFD